jgi:hypothetical protein
MADFVYDKTKKTFVGHGQNWKVRSGIPGSYSPTPNGLYTAPKGSLMAGAPGYGVPHDPKYAKAPYSDTNDALYCPNPDFIAGSEFAKVILVFVKDD